MLQPSKSLSHRAVASPVATVPQSRDILLKQSRDRLAGAGSGSGSFSSSTGRSVLTDENKSLDSLSVTKSAAAYLGSSADGHSPVMRWTVMRNRAANAVKCWQRPESEHFTGQDHFLSSLLYEESDDPDSEKKESSTNVSPSYRAHLPFLEFKKADYLHDISPLSLSVQCGSDVDDVDHMYETSVIPTNRLTSRRVWNMKTCSWEEVNEHHSTNSSCSNHEGQDSCDLSDVDLRPVNRDAEKIVFTKADTTVKSSELVCSSSTFWFADIQRTQCSFSETDIQNAQSRLRKHQNIAMCLQPAVRNVDIGASNKTDRMPRNRHSVIGGTCDERLLSTWHHQTIQDVCRAKSCPEMTVLPSHSIHTSNTVCRRRRRHHKVSQFVSNARQTVSKSSERRRRVSRRVTGRHNLAPPLFASWPGKGDIKGSILAYESSV